MEKQKVITQQEVIVDLLAKDITYIKEKVVIIEKNLENKYVTQDQFAPVKNIVYGLVTLILIAVVGALLTLIIRK
jgi:hypothetical protein